MSPPTRPTAEIPRVRFAPARGGRVAYQVFGRGDGPTTVSVPPMAQNIEASWEWPALRAMFDRLGSFSRHLHYDKRGTGSSDRVGVVPGLDERVDELKAVLDHARSDGVEGPVHLLAHSEGGPSALMFAATYPHRVASVTLFGSGARMAPDGMDETVRVEQHRLRTAFAEVWGTEDSMVVPIFAPSLVDDPTYRAWHLRYERLAAGSDSIRELLFEMLDIDVRDVLARLDLPVLVMHRTNDPAVPIELGVEAAELIPGAEFVELDGVDHFAYVGDQDAWLDRFERFVTGTVTARKPPSGPGAVRVESLGRFAVLVDGEEVPTSAWGSRRARTLLKRLVAAQGWPVTRDELTALLWPDETDPSKLSARLSVQLSNVRRVLGGGVVADRQTIALDRAHVTTDLQDYLAAEADADIVSRYRGEFLPEERYEDWSGPLRDELRSRFVAAAHRELARLVGAPSAADAAALAWRLIEADRWDHSAHDSLVEALRLAGDEVGAARAEQARAELRTELGLDGRPEDEPADEPDDRDPRSGAGNPPQR